MTARSLGVFGAAALVAVTLGLSLPVIRARFPLTPDGIEYVGIAHSFVEGRGWVDPIAYSYYLPEPRPPMAAAACRAPVFSLLLTIPLALGASLKQISVLHAIWGALIGLGGALLAVRSRGWIAGVVFGIGFVWSYAWIAMNQRPLTEATSVGVLFAIVYGARRALGSKRVALGLAALSVVAWLTRPNLGLVVPAVVFAGVLELGPRLALRSHPLWTYLLGFVAIQQLVKVLVGAITGTALYANYGMLAEVLTFSDVARFQYEFMGVTGFLRENSAAVLATITSNAAELGRVLFLLPDYHYVGWVAVPALVHGAFGFGDPANRFERRLIAILALGLLVFCAITWAPFDWRRYPVPGGACLWLSVACWFAAIAETSATRISSSIREARHRGIARAVRVAPIALVAAVFATSSAPGMIAVARRGLQAQPATLPDYLSTPSGRAAREFCRWFEPEATVAATDPWALHLSCGIAASVLAVDLENEVWVERFIERLTPQWIVSTGYPAYRALRTSPLLERVAESHGHVLYRVRETTREQRSWRAVTPLAGTRRVRAEGDGAAIPARDAAPPHAR